MGIWHWTYDKGQFIQRERKPTAPTVWVLLYAPFQVSTYHSLSYTCHGALTGMKKCSVNPPLRIDLTTHRSMSECSTTELPPAPQWWERKPYLFYLWRVWVRCRLEVMLAAHVLLQLVQNFVESPLQRGHVSLRPRLVTGQGVTLHGDLLVTNNTSATTCEVTGIGDILITITAVVYWQGSISNQTNISQTFKRLGYTEHKQGRKEMFY